MPASSGDRYKVCWSEKNREATKGIGIRAARLDLKSEFIEALKMIVEKLAAEPLDWGDPQYRFRSAKLIICHGIHAPLQVFYGVDEARHLVYIKEIAALPGHPLSEEV